jgi:iron complex transport system substrate-binding protein
MIECVAVRVASLLPSASEIVCALGAERELVGISHECDFPRDIRDRPVLTQSRIGPLGSSREIDATVRSALRDALSIHAVDERALTDGAPDVIVTQDLCEVCAVSLDDVRAAVSRLANRSNIAVVSLKPTRLADALDDIERVGAAIGRPVAARELRETLQARIDEIAQRARPLDVRPRVISLEWIDPLMLGGTWMPELIELAGGHALGAHPGQSAPTISVAQLAELRPDVVLIKPCGFDVPRTLSERSVIEQSVLAAVGRTTRVYVTDGNAYFNRPGPPLVESLEIMAACVHPTHFEDFQAKHREVIVRVDRAA